MLVKDIHPEGIFLLSTEGKKEIRILSIDNGHKFIEEDFRNGFRLSKTTNLLDVETNQNIQEINSFIRKMKEFVASKELPVKKNIDIDIIPPARSVDN